MAHVATHTHTHAQHHSYTNDREDLLARMKKIEGQAQGVQRMIEEGRYCIDIVQQLDALAAAARGVSLLILKDHIEGCVADAVKEGHPEPYIDELISVLRKAIRG